MKEVYRNGEVEAIESGKLTGFSPFPVLAIFQTDAHLLIPYRLMTPAIEPIPQGLCERGTFAAEMYVQFLKDHPREGVVRFGQSIYTPAEWRAYPHPLPRPIQLVIANPSVALASGMTARYVETLNERGYGCEYRIGLDALWIYSYLVWADEIGIYKKESYRRNAHEGLPWSKIGRIEAYRARGHLGDQPVYVFRYDGTAKGRIVVIPSAWLGFREIAEAMVHHLQGCQHPKVEDLPESEPFIVWKHKRKWQSPENSVGRKWFRASI